VLEERKHTALLGLIFLIFLALSFVANALFFQLSNIILENQLLSVGMIFLNNIIFVSLILLGMTFYVNLVLSNFFKGQKYEYAVLNHPRIFSITFTVIILFLGIMRGSIVFFGGISLEMLPLILLGSTPIGIIEGYGVYLTIDKTIRRSISIKALAHIYSIFLIAAVIEVVFMNLIAQGPNYL
jgi:hypothetical protein